MKSKGSKKPSVLNDKFREELLAVVDVPLERMAGPHQACHRPLSSIDLVLDSLTPVVTVTYPAYSYFLDPDNSNAVAQVPAVRVVYVGRYTGNQLKWEPSNATTDAPLKVSPTNNTESTNDNHHR